jgi:cytochrome c553
VTRIAALAIAAALPVCVLAADPPGRAKAQPCSVCHGPAGISVQPDAPNLAGQPRVYLIEQLKNLRSGKRPSEVMNLMAKPLTDDDIAALADWYSSIAIEAKERP